MRIKYLKKRDENRIILINFINFRSTSVFLVYCGAAYSNETSKVYDIFMNICVAPREVREIDKRGGGQNKLRGVSKNHEK